MKIMTYGEAIAYLANNGYVFKAIRDLSECAQLFVDDLQKEKSELKAEKRTVKRFLESADLDTDQRLSAISTLLEEEEA